MITLETRISTLFDELVPASGKADTVAGEIIRAVSRISYRNSNDGDHVGVGYGKETCNPAARYLMEMAGREVREAVRNMWGIWDDDAYDKAVETLAEKIAVQFMQAGQQLPVKNSYMFCDTLDMCFFYGPGDTPKVAYAGHAGADERDITEGKLVEAFRKADTVLRAMKRFAGEEG